MTAIANLVEQTSTTTGTGNLTLVAVDARQTCAEALGTGSTNRFPYFVMHKTADEWEAGFAYMSDDATMVRETIVESSNSGSVVNFSAGTKRVTNAFPAWLLSQSVTENAKFYGAKGDGSTNDTAALQAAFDALSAQTISKLYIPAGEYICTSDLTLQPTSGSVAQSQVIIEGDGAGPNGTYIHFTTAGSLIIHHGNHVVRDIHVKSNTDNGIEIAPTTITATNYYPTRSYMENVRAEYCGGSGITFEDCWIYTLLNCFFRFNDVAGIEGKTGALTGLACNSLNIIGGELQGNGTIVSSGASRGTGAGLITGRCVQLTCYNVAIEGNYGDGAFLSEQLRGAIFDGCYFEKNGTNETNRDITNFVGASLPSSSTNAPNSVIIRNCNFTPQNYNASTAQERAIDLYDVQDLKIINSQFYALSGPVLYSAEPIRVREQTNNRCTGWCEGVYFSSASYTQDLLKNETYRYGRQRKVTFCEYLAMPDAVTTTSKRYVVPMSTTNGWRIDVNHLTRPSSGTGNAIIVTTIRRGPSGSTISIKTDTVTYTFSTRAVLTENTTQYTAAPWEYVEIDIYRDGANGSDTLTVDSTLLSTEIIVYEGVVDQA